MQSLQQAPEQATSAAAAIAKVAPSVVVSGISLWGVPLNDILAALVYIATLAYTLAQFYFLVRDKVRRNNTQRGRRS